MPKTSPAELAPELAPSSRRLVAMPLSELVPAARNPKKHDLPALTGAMAKFGYVEAITLDERTGRLVAGHGRVESLRKAKAADEPAPAGIDVRESDGEWLVPVQRGWASANDEEAEAYLIASNRLVESGGWYQDALTDVLGELSLTAGLVELTGYTLEEVDDMIAAQQEAAAASLPGAADDDDEDDDDNPLDKQQRTTAGINDRADDYAASNQRVVVLSFPGNVYVWVVNKLSHLMTEHDVESNSDTVLKVLEQVTGETAPAPEGE